eukprot:SM000281S10759  [mRNA]  locus=s281:88899:92032:- [translate_table: standard]
MLPRAGGRLYPCICLGVAAQPLTAALTGGHHPVQSLPEPLALDPVLEPPSLSRLMERVSTLRHQHAELRQALSSSDRDRALQARLEHDCKAARETATASGGAGVVEVDGSWDEAIVDLNLEKVRQGAKASRGSARGRGAVHPVYELGLKVVYAMEKGQVGVCFKTTYREKYLEAYYCVLASSSNREDLSYAKSTLPYFLKLDAMTNVRLSSGRSIRLCLEQISHLLNAYVSRREQVQELLRAQPEHLSVLYHSISYSLVEMMVVESGCNIQVSLEYGESEPATLPTKATVVAWTVTPSLRRGSRSAAGVHGRRAQPLRLRRSEDALRHTNLPEAYEAIVSHARAALRKATSTGDQRILPAPALCGSQPPGLPALPGAHPTSATAVEGATEAGNLQCPPLEVPLTVPASDGTKDAIKDNLLDPAHVSQ